MKRIAEIPQPTKLPAITVAPNASWARIRCALRSVCTHCRIARKGTLIRSEATG
jgi:hypothetical protein